MGIDTGIDMDRLIECVWLCQEVVGHPLYGHVSPASPVPRQLRGFYDPDIAFMETLDQARYFKLGSRAYEGGLSPWKGPIESPYWECVEKGLSAYDPPGQGSPGRRTGLFGA